MTDPEETALAFVDAAALTAWFQENHDREDELWVRIFKTATDVPSVSWNDCVEASLAWGWIDGLKRSGGEAIWYQRLTPRRARSNWSARNIAIASRLITDGQMQPAGLAQVQRT